MGTFGARLRQARLELAARAGREVRQTDVAAHMGVSRAAYSQWEGGGTEPKNRKDYEKLAKYLGVDPGWLAFGTDNHVVIPPHVTPTRPLPELEALKPTRKRRA